MKLDPNELQQLNLDDLKRVRRYAKYKRTLHKITSLHPRQIVIPVALFQIVAFSVLVTKSLVYTVVANMVIVGIAFLPFALRKPISQMEEINAIHKKNKR